MKWLERASLIAGPGIVLGELFHRLAGVHGDRPLVDEHGDGLRLTYFEARDRVDRLAAGLLALGARPGDRVVLAFANGYDVLLGCVAAARLGALAVPVNPQMSPAEIDHVVADSGAAVVVRSADEALKAGSGTPSPTPPRTRPEATDVAAIFYSSGTTGSPKGARLTHRALVGQLHRAAIWPSWAREDRAVAGLPVAHIMGFGVLAGFAAAGIPLTLLPRFRPLDALDAIEGRRATMFVGVPAMYRMLLDAGAEERDLRSVRVWMSGADAMPAELAARFRKMGGAATLPFIGATLGQAAFVEGYGLVEVGGGAAAKFGSWMVPLPGYRFRVVDDAGRSVRMGRVGHLETSGPGVLAGYHGDPAATSRVITEDGWLRTGDLVRRGLGALVAFQGRDKDVVKRGGYSVYAVEVEQVLESHPSVSEAIVVGLPDQRLGEEVAAAVCLAAGQGAAEGDLMAWCRERLAEYKVPSMVRFVDELPRTGTDKVRRAEVRALLSGRASASEPDGDGLGRSLSEG